MILNYLGIGEDASKEPGADRRRDRIAAWIDKAAEATIAKQAQEIAAKPTGWRDMASAPRDGKHCILSIQEGAFFWSVQGAFQGGQWNCVHRANVEPLAWMPNVLLPDELYAPAIALSTLNQDQDHAG